MVFWIKLFCSNSTVDNAINAKNIVTCFPQFSPNKCLQRTSMENFEVTICMRFVCDSLKNMVIYNVGKEGWTKNFGTGKSI